MTNISDPGKSFPIGATVYPDGVNFCVYSKNSTGMELLFFDDKNDAKPSNVIVLDPQHNRTFSYWHIFVPDIQPGQVYAYRAQGPFDPQRGLRFDSDKILIDPYSRAIAIPDHYNRDAAAWPGANTAVAMKSVVADTSHYDWEGDLPIRRSFEHTVIYEMHVRGFTRHPSSGMPNQKRGTYAALIEKIPYLQDLGITAVELLPIFQFDEQEAPDGLKNYWGYNPVSFFVPHCGYSSQQHPLEVLDEFRDMVKALHSADIEVILDVVYNHTAEANHLGPTFCYRGLENRNYYILEEDRSRYANFSGTGNTLNANDSMVRRLILDSLHYWVEEMHVDGFRFDLASIFSRDRHGKPLANPPILWDIENDPILAGTKLIAEAWDAGGLYQVGNFGGDHWKEWNGQFRDDVRALMKGDPGMVNKVASRFFASPDIYGHEEREPEQSINFVTCHDGFTMNDLVSYDEKQNLANGEDNRDGSDYNLSWNCGEEGPTDDPIIENLRLRQIKNFFTINLLALGVPMLSMGDEVRRTQLGNNNAYCQDNEISWFDWNLVEEHADLHDFVKRLIRLRLNLAIFRENHGLSLTELLHEAKIQWHGIELHQPDSSYASRSLAFSVWGQREVFHIIINAYWEALEFQLPPICGHGQNGWRRVIDTFLDSPDDFCELVEAPRLNATKYMVQPRSVVVLACEVPKDPGS